MYSCPVACKPSYLFLMTFVTRFAFLSVGFSRSTAAIVVKTSAAKTMLTTDTGSGTCTTKSAASS